MRKSWFRVDVFYFFSLLFSSSSLLYSQNSSPNDSAALIEKNKIVSDVCKTAMEYYYRGDYTSAIRCWEEALKHDPHQIPPRQMIELARKKIEEKVNPLAEEIRKLVLDGKYTTALSKNSELIVLDPTNPVIQTRMNKIKKISGIIRDISDKKNRSADVLRRSLYNYIYKEENVRHSIIGLRYVLYLEPSNTSVIAIKDLLEKEYPIISQMEKDAPGVNVLESKLASALDNIYDGRYDKAIADCNDALFLEPDNVLALKRLGSAYWALGDKNKARTSWRSASAIDPQDEELKKFLKLK